jgi:lipopolysaccharide transport system ATP-binding protein
MQKELEARTRRFALFRNLTRWQVASPQFRNPQSAISSMSDTIISVEKVGKCYVLSHKGNGERYTALRDVIARRTVAPFRAIGEKMRVWNGSHPYASLRPLSNNSIEKFWALKDVSFEIKQGNVVGIIGRNGAGKSTLLKILSRITEPTEGRIRIRGRVASLLEVGTGFHPELTGRENIYLNGAILGMSRAEIKSKFDEIVAFAEVEKFLDTPVKRYSSGMYVRLAFAVAAHLEPEILVVDEVLAVGDAEFQRKCLGKMEAVAGGGRTVLFVSHNIGAVTSLTKTCALLQAGRCVFFGETQDAVAKYLSSVQSEESRYEASPNASKPSITRVEVFCSRPGAVHESGAPMRIEFDFYHPESIPGACCSFQIVNQAQVPVLHLCAYDHSVEICKGSGSTTVVCRIPRLNLNVGQYSLTAYFADPPGGQSYQLLVGICQFRVVILNKTSLWGWRPEVCTYHEEAEWTALLK